VARSRWLRKINQEKKTMKNQILHAAGTMVVLALTVIQSFGQSTYEPYTFTTLAGGGGNSTNAAGSVVRFRDPVTVAVDSAGNLYVAEQGNNSIRQVTPAGAVRTLAGRPGSFGSADGTGSAARFNGPSSAAVDKAGNVYVADTFNCTIRKVTSGGEVTTLAGLAGSPGSADGTGRAARFNFPFGVAADNSGNVYLADSDNHTIRKVTPVGTNWVVTTIAGRAGNFGSANGTGSTARFNFPAALILDGSGQIYVADGNNHTIRRMSPAGTNWIVTTIAGRAGVLGSADGTNSNARVNGAGGMAFDSGGNLYVADWGNSAVRKMTPDGTNWVVTTVAGLPGSFGSVDGTNSDARFNITSALAIDSANNVYVADLGNNLIRKMTQSGTNWVITTLVGLGGNHGGTDGRGNIALFKGPSGVALDSAGNTYVADQINHTIRKVTPAGEVTTLAGLAGYAGSANGTNSAARFADPGGVAVDNSGNVYVADTLNNTIRKIRPAGPDWAVTTLAGFPDPLNGGGSADGTGSSARFSFPRGLALDSAGNLYVADTGNSTIRRVTPAGSVTTRAGSGQAGSTDGTGGTARFNSPFGVALDSATNIYVADTFNHTIRKITPTRVVSTLAGQAGVAGSTDGIGNAARFDFSSAIAVDPIGNLYVTDAHNNTIRKLTPIGTNWVVTTLGGMPGFYGTADGTGSAARFSNPSGVALDSEGNVYVADFYFNTIRKGYPAPKILNPVFTVGQFGFDLTGATGHSVVVETSTELVNWLPAWTNTFGTQALHFIDPQGGISPNRFYRTRLP
jgi:hypothetical protein